MIPFLDSRIERLIAAFLAGVIAILIFLLHLSNNQVETYREDARQARQAVAELQAAGRAAEAERLAAQQAKAARDDLVLKEAKEKYEADLASVTARYDAAVRRLRNQARPTTGSPGGNPPVPPTPSATSVPDGGTAELRLVEALRSCEEGVARHNAVVRALRETR